MSRNHEGFVARRNSSMRASRVRVVSGSTKAMRPANCSLNVSSGVRSAVASERARSRGH